MAFNIYGNQFGNPYGGVTPPQQQNTGIVWVQGEEAAKAYLVAPNNTVTLWDAEKQKIYIKSADASGMPSMRVISWQEDEKPNLGEKNKDFVTRDELEEILEKYALKKESKENK